jgi:hypothetical protein
LRSTDLDASGAVSYSSLLDLPEYRRKYLCFPLGNLINLGIESCCNTPFFFNPRGMELLGIPQRPTTLPGTTCHRTMKGDAGEEVVDKRGGFSKNSMLIFSEFKPQWNVEEMERMVKTRPFTKKSGHDDGAVTKVIVFPGLTDAVLV